MCIVHWSNQWIKRKERWSSNHLTATSHQLKVCTSLHYKVTLCVFVAKKTGVSCCLTILLEWSTPLGIHHTLSPTQLRKVPRHEARQQLRPSTVWTTENHLCLARLAQSCSRLRDNNLMHREVRWAGLHKAVFCILKKKKKCYWKAIRRFLTAVKKSSKTLLDPQWPSSASAWLLLSHLSWTAVCLIISERFKSATNTSSDTQLHRLLVSLYPPSALRMTCFSTRTRPRHMAMPSSCFVQSHAEITGWELGVNIDKISQ